jgi:mono/diheme cytochrome c family protein
MPRFGPAAALVTLLLCAAACGGSRLPASDPVMQRGLELYSDNCLVCHQAGGGGVADLQPALVESSKVLGDPATLVRWVLLGSEAEKATGGRRYQNVMPAFDHLGDEDLAAIVTYVRQTFGNGASPASPALVAESRKSLGTR